MGFINPWALAIGGLALAVPVIVHFLTRPRPQPMPLSTIHLVFESLQQKRSRHRLRDVIVLLLRMLAIAMIAAAIARPLWRSSVINTSQSDSSVARVVMIDVSASMGAGRGGNQPIQRSHAIADRYLRERVSLSAAVILIDARPESFYQDLSRNLNVLRDRARSAKPTSQAADVRAAMKLAGELLRKTDAGVQREVVIISDFQRSDWGAMRLTALPKGTRVQLESVAADDSANIAVLRVDRDDRIVAGRSSSYSVQIRNDTKAERTLDCKLTLGDQTETIRQTFPLGQSNVVFTAKLDRPGPHAGTVQLIDTNSGILGDDLPEDDLRVVSVDALPPAQVALLTNQSEQQIPSSSYYLQSAAEQLFRSSPENAPERRTVPENHNASVHRFSVNRMNSGAFDDADILILDHPGRLPSLVVKQIAAKLQRGSGLFYVASELADAVNIAALQKEVGASMRLPVKFFPQRGGRPRRDLAIDELQRRESPFSVFGDATEVAVESLRFGGGLATKPTEEALADRVLASLEDRSALLVASDTSAGRIAILNADLQQSNLAVQPAFLPLLGELLTGLMPVDSGDSNLDCGQTMMRLLPASVRPEDSVGLRPVGDWPTDDSGHGSVVASAAGMAWNWNAPVNRGVYGAFSEGKLLTQIAVNLPASESELTALRPESIDVSSMIGDDGVSAADVGFRDATTDLDDKDRWWNGLLALCVLGLVCEMLSLRIFGN